MAVRLQCGGVGILRKTCDHSNGRRTGSLEPFSGSQQRIRSLHGAPARTALTLLQRHPQRHIAGDHRADLQAECGPTAIGHLQMPLAQISLDAGIQEQSDALTPHGTQPQITCSETVKGISLDVVNAGITPVKGRTVHHIRMRDQTTTGCCQAAGTGQGIARKAADLTADPCGNHHQGGEWSCHGVSTVGVSTTASTCTHCCPAALTARPVIAQRSGCPWGCNC